MPLQIVIEITRFRVAKEIWNGSLSRKIVAFAEFTDRKTVLRSSECTVNVGSQYCLPWDEKMDKVTLYYFFIDGLLTTEIGSSVYELAKDKDFRQGCVIRTILDIKMKGCTSRIGKVMCSVSVQGVFEEDSNHPLPRQTNIDREFSLSVPGFRFKRLSRAVHWQRVRGLNIDRVLQNHDTRSLLACLDDVVSGDASQEDIDPKLHKALQLQQYSAQYLLSCHSLLRDKEKIVRTALRTFEDEERMLDLKIAKMRSREKALERESRECDRMCSNYTALLRDLSPRLMDDLYHSYRSKLNRQRQDDAAEESLERREIDSRRDIRGAKVLAISGHNAIQRQQHAHIEQEEFIPHLRRADEKWGKEVEVYDYTHKKIISEQMNQPQHVKSSSVAHYEDNIYLPNRDESVPTKKKSVQSNVSSDEEEEEKEDFRENGFKPVRRVTAFSSALRSTTSGNTNSNGPESVSVLAGGVRIQSQQLSPPRSSVEPQSAVSTSHHVDNSSAAVRQSTVSNAMSVDSLAPQEEVHITQSKAIAVPIRVPVTLLRSASVRDTSSSDSDIDSGDGRDVKKNQLSQTFPNRHQTSQSNLSSSARSSVSNSEAEEETDPRRYAEESFADQSVSMLDLDAHPKVNPSHAAPQARTDDKGSKSGRDREQEDSQEKYDYKRHSPQSYEKAPLRAKTSSPAPSKNDVAHQSNDDKHRLSSEESSLEAEEPEEDDQYDDDPFSPYPQDRDGRSPHTFDSRLDGSSAFSPQPRSAHHRNLDMSGDIDASSSVVIDFAFPTHGVASKRAAEQLGINTGDVNNAHRNSGTNDVLRQSTRWDEDSSSQPDSMGTLQLVRQGDDDSPFGDNVLLGTAKRSVPFNLSKRLLGDTDPLNDSDAFDRDSLAGTVPLRPRPSVEPSQRLSESPWGGTSSIPEEEEIEESSTFVDRGSMDSAQQIAALTTPQWVMGRADMESIELAQAFDVFVSALRLEDLQEDDANHEQAVVSLCFLGIESAQSSKVALRGNSSIQPLSFSAHMRFNESTAELLRTEISEFEDLLAFQINVTALGANGQTTVMLAQAHINLWVMVEDACNILRQEVDIMSIGGGEMDLQVVGSAVVDVRGYRLLQKYAV